MNSMLGYEDHLVAEALKPRTITRYQAVLRRALEWCEQNGVDLTTVTATQIRDMAATFPLSHSTRSQLRAALLHYWTLHERWNPPAGAVRVPHAPKYENRALSPQDAMALAKTVQYWYPQGTAVMFGIYLGLRASEIAAAEWSRISEDGWYQAIGKGDRTRTLPVHPVLLDDLPYVRRQAPGRWLFPGSRGRPHVAYQTIWEWVRVACEQAQIARVSPHQLRHLAITEVHDRTGDLRVAQAFAGHANISTTKIYTRVNVRKLKQAVESIDYFNPIEED
jgi:integrase